MHTLRHISPFQVLVNLLTCKRNDWCNNLDEGHQDLVEGIIRLLLIRIVLALPETPSATADVPIVQVIDERNKGCTRLLDVIGIK